MARKIRKVEFNFKNCKDRPKYGVIYCSMRPTPYKKIWFSLGIVITRKEWESYVAVNYLYHTRMPTLDILYHKFADFMDKVHDTVETSKFDEAKGNVQKLILRMCTKQL